MYIHKYIDIIKSNLNQICPDAHRKKLMELQTNNFFFLFKQARVNR